MLASPMLLEGSEWLVVVVIIGALLVFGPEKIPQLAKQVGRAKAEFDKASTEARTMMDTAMKSIDQEASAATASINSVANSVGSVGKDMMSSFESTANEMRSSFSAPGAGAKSATASAPVGASAVPPPVSPAPASVASPERAASPQTSEVDADAMLKLAHRMGISTDGKTRDEISEEIFSRSAPQPKTESS